MKIHKWTDIDWDTFTTLMKHATSTNQSNPIEYLDTLKSTKYNVAQNIDLGCRNNFAKNFKAFDYITSGPLTFGIGVSSIYIPVAELIEHFTIDKVIAEMSRLQEKKNLGLFIVITKYEKGPKRELVKEMLLFSDRDFLDEGESQYIDLKKELIADQNKKLTD